MVRLDVAPTRFSAQAFAASGIIITTAVWIRSQGFTDPRKAPNHALRHWFKTTAPRAGISDSLADAIQGHADATTAGRYRHFALADVAEAVARLPVPVAHPNGSAAPRGGV